METNLVHTTLDPLSDREDYLARAEEAIARTDTWDGAAIALAILALAQELRQVRETLRHLRWLVPE